MSARDAVFLTVTAPREARAGELVPCDDSGRCGLATETVQAGERVRLLIYGTAQGLFVNYPYRVELTTYGVWPS